MVYISKIVGAVATACLAGTAVAHPGEHHDHQAVKREIRARDQMASAAKRSISSCSSSLKHRQVAARSVARRAAVARELRERRNIKARMSLGSYLCTLTNTLQLRPNTAAIWQLSSCTKLLTIMKLASMITPARPLRRQSSAQIHPAS
jgi:hypothetical protein